VAAIDRALSLDPRSAAAHEARAIVLYQLDFDPAAAELELQKAVAIDPTVPGLDWLKGYIALVQCRFPDALRAFAAARELNPLASDVPVQIGNTYYRSGDLNAARTAFSSVLALRPASGSVHYRLGLVALRSRDAAAALAEFEREPDPDFKAVGPPLAYDAMGRKADADRAIAAAMQTAANGAAYQIALIYAARGDSDNALVWLDRAYAQRDAGMLWIKCDPLLMSLQGDARFKTLLRKMHLD
jgi:tetratricopeptide (TPR) repeat protein